MKRIIRTGFLLIIIAMTMASCVKLSEDVTTEKVKRPQYNIEIPITPPWDEPQQGDSDMGQ